MISKVRLKLHVALFRVALLRHLLLYHHSVALASRSMETPELVEVILVCL